MTIPYKFSTAVGSIPLDQLDADFDYVANIVPEFANSATTAGTVTASAQPNITSVGTLGVLSVIGNITTDSYFRGNGAYLTGLPASYGNSNVAAYLPTYSGTLSPSSISVTGNIVSSNITSSTVLATNIRGANIRATTALYANVDISAGGNITGSNISGGNITGNSITSTGQISASGNVVGSYIIGNGSLLTGLPANYGNSNVASYLPTYTGNLEGGNLHITNSATVDVNLIAAGNVTGSYILGNGAYLTGLPASYGNANVAAYLPTYPGVLVGSGASVTGAILANTVTAAFGIRGGNVRGTLGVYANVDVSAGGNVIGSNILSGGDILAGGAISANGNITGANLITSGLVVAGGNATISGLNSGPITAAGGGLFTGDYTISGNLTITGTTTTADSTTVSFTDPIVTLNEVANSWPTVNTGSDIGHKYIYYSTAAVPLAVISGSGDGANVTLTGLQVQYPLGFIVNVSGLDIPEWNGLWRVNAATANSFSFSNSTAGTSSTIGQVTRVVTLNTDSGTSSGTTATINYSPSKTLIEAGDLIVLSNIVPYDYNGTYTVQTASNGTFTVTTLNSNFGPITTQGKITVGERFAFAGRSAVTGYFEFYGVGAELPGNVFNGVYGTVKAGAVVFESASTQTTAQMTNGWHIRMPEDVTYNIEGGTLDQVSAIRIDPQDIGGLVANTVFTNASMLYIGGAPVAATNATIGNAYSIQVASGNSYFGGNVFVDSNLSATGNVSVIGNVRGANFNTYGTILATGNIRGGNLVSINSVSATGNIEGSYLLGNGSQLTGISYNNISNIPALSFYGYFPGTTTSTVGTARRFAASNYTVTKISAWAASAVSTDTVVTLLKNGVVAGSATIAAGNTQGNSAPLSISVLTTDYVTLDLTSTGAVDVGARIDYQ